MKHLYKYLCKHTDCMLVPDPATLTPRTLIAAGMGQEINVPLPPELPDRFDFVGATNYSMRVNNLCRQLREAREKQKQTKPEPQPEPQAQPKTEPQE